MCRIPPSGRCERYGIGWVAVGLVGSRGVIGASGFCGFVRSRGSSRSFAGSSEGRSAGDRSCCRERFSLLRLRSPAFCPFFRFGLTPCFRPDSAPFDCAATGVGDLSVVVAEP
jgi:hypothetical protein